MKKYINKILPVFLAGFLAASFNGCILDAFNSLPINVPMTFEFFTAGTSTFLTSTDTLRLDSSQTFMDYYSNVQNISFLSIAYRTDTVSAGLKGDLSLTIIDKDGNPLISKTYSGISPADYISKPLKIQISQDMINNINNYLNSNIPVGEKVFIGTITIHVTNGDSPYFIHGFVDIALQMDTNI